MNKNKLDPNPQHEDLSQRLVENHQALIKDAFQKGETKVRIGGEIYDILENGEKLDLKFSKKDPDSIFYVN